MAPRTITFVKKILATGEPCGKCRDVEERLTVDVTTVLDRKVAALAAHRSQYAMDPGILPRSMLERLLGMEHFVVAAVANT